MRAALGIDGTTRRTVRVLEDGTRDDAAGDVAAAAVAVGDDLSEEVVEALLEELREVVGREVLPVSASVAARFADDVAVGAALWALGEDGRRRGLVVPPVAPVGGVAPAQAPSSGAQLSDFGDGRSMSDFGDGQSMSDFAEPSRMSDFGDGSSMSDFGDGRSMADHEAPTEAQPAAEPPPEPLAEPVRDLPVKRFPKVQVAVAAAVAVAVIAVAAIALAGGTDEVPIAAEATTTEQPTTTTSTTTLPAERTFGVGFTITSTNADQFPDAPLKTGQTGTADVTVTCEAGTCRFSLKATGGQSFGVAIADVVLNGDSLTGTEQTVVGPLGEGGCERQHVRTVTASITDGAISGEASFTADPLTCPGPTRNTIHVFTLDFDGTETTGTPTVTPLEGQTVG